MVATTVISNMCEGHTYRLWEVLYCGNSSLPPDAWHKEAVCMKRETTHHPPSPLKLFTGWVGWCSGKTSGGRMRGGSLAFAATDKTESPKCACLCEL